MSAEVPQDFLAPSEAEAGATTNGISLVPDILEEEVAQLMAQELPYTVFDADTEVAVASMLNAKMEFDEALLTENVALQFGPHCGSGEAAEVEGQSEEARQEDSQRPPGGGADDDNDDHSPYLKFSRVVVVREPSEEGESPSRPQTIPQLDGADGGSDSDESEAAGGGSGPSGPTGSPAQSPGTKKLTVALQRLESFVAPQKRPPDPEQSSVSQSAVLPLLPLAAGPGPLDSHLLAEEVVLDSESATQEKGLLDPATGHFISTDDGTIVRLANKPGLVLDNSTSSTDSMDDALDSPLPEVPPPKPTVAPKSVAPASVKLIFPKPCAPQHSSEMRLPITSRFLHSAPAPAPAPAAVSSAPRMVTSPIVINGLSALPMQTGAPRGRTIAIRFDSSKPGAQQLLIPAQAGASHWVTSVPPTPQVLLVNRQGQILLKDPRSNTYQTLNQNSPAYGKISQVAKMLHGGNTLQRSVPRVIVKPRAGSSHPAPSPSRAPGAAPSPIPTHTLAAPHHATAFGGRVIVRTVPVNHMVNASVSAPGIQAGTAQAIINQAIANQRHTPHLPPVILKASQRPMPRILTPTQFKALPVSGKAALPDSTPTVQPDTASLKEAMPWHHSQAGIKRLATLTDRPGRKRCRTDFIRDSSPSRDLDGPPENRWDSAHRGAVLLSYSRCVTLTNQNTAAADE